MSFPQNEVLVYLPAYYPDLEFTKVSLESFEQDIRPISRLKFDVLIIDPNNNKELLEYASSKGYYYVKYDIPDKAIRFDWAINNMPFCICKNTYFFRLQQGRKYQWSPDFDNIIKHRNIGLMRTESYTKEPTIIFDQIKHFTTMIHSPYDLFGDWIIKGDEFILLNGINECFSSLHKQEDVEFNTRYINAFKQGKVRKMDLYKGCLTYLGPLWPPRQNKKLYLQDNDKKIDPCPKCIQKALSTQENFLTPKIEFKGFDICYECGSPTFNGNGIDYINYLNKNNIYKAEIVENYGYDLSYIRNECMKMSDLKKAAEKFNELKKIKKEVKRNMIEDYDLNSDQNKHGLSNHVSDKLFKCINNVVEIKDLLDVGCGTGDFLQHAKQNGCKLIEGIEGRHEHAEMALEKNPGAIKEKDIRHDDMSDVSAHDVVTSIEVIEHINEKYENKMLTLLASRAKKWLIVSAAPPGQDGVFHVNLKPKQYWIDKIQKMGFIYRDDLYNKYLENVSKHDDIPYWHKNNMMFFEKKQRTILTDSVHGTLDRANKKLFEDRLNEKWYVMDTDWPAYLNLKNINCNNVIKYSEFKNHNFDIIMVSTPDNFYEIKKLCKDMKINSKIIFHAGNNYNMDWSQVDNAMLSCAAQPNIKNKVTYHQEFDTKNEYNYVTYVPKKTNIISTFLYDSKHEEVEKIEQKLPEFKFKYYGKFGKDRMELDDFAPTNPSQIHISKAMKNSMFIFHLKEIGDGYGHVVHNTFACGRILVTRKSYYKGMLAECLMEDEKTFLDIDGLSHEQIAEKIRKWSDPKLYRQLSVGAKDRFREVVNFDKEELAIREFLVNLT